MVASATKGDVTSVLLVVTSTKGDIPSHFSVASASKGDVQVHDVQAAMPYVPCMDIDCLTLEADWADYVCKSSRSFPVNQLLSAYLGDQLTEILQLEQLRVDTSTDTFSAWGLTSDTCVKPLGTVEVSCCTEDLT